VTTGSVVVPGLGVKPPEPSYAAEPVPTNAATLRRSMIMRYPRRLLRPSKT
jgi:hypothetical protein